MNDWRTLCDVLSEEKFASKNQEGRHNQHGETVPLPEGAIASWGATCSSSHFPFQEQQQHSCGMSATSTL